MFQMRLAANFQRRMKESGARLINEVVVVVVNAPKQTPPQLMFQPWRKITTCVITRGVPGPVDALGPRDTGLAILHRHPSPNIVSLVHPSTQHPPTPCPFCHLCVPRQTFNAVGEFGMDGIKTIDR